MFLYKGKIREEEAREEKKKRGKSLNDSRERSPHTQSGI